MRASDLSRAWRVATTPVEEARELLEQVAGLLAGSPRGHGLLLESAPGAPAWGLVAPRRGPDLDPVAERSGGLLERSAVPAAPAAPPPTGGWMVGLRCVPRRPPEAGRSWVRGITGLGVQVHWVSCGNGRLAVRPRWLVQESPSATEPALAPWAGWRERTEQLGGAVEVVAEALGRRARRHWQSGRGGPSVASAVEMRAATAAELLLPTPRVGWPEPAELRHHLAVFGTTGAGKTSALAALACAQVRAGRSVIVLDLHGDLAPRTVGALPVAERRAVVGLDVADPRGVHGIALFGADDDRGRAREAAQLVAALRRLSSERGETYWGHRLERIFDVMVRRVQEEGGTLADLHALLTDPARREAARLATRVPAIARFLDELPATLRRNPEYLQSAAARLEKVVLDPRLFGLLSASPGEALSLPELLARGRSVVVRLPVGELGPEGAAFAASLIAGRLYLALASSGSAPAEPRGSGPPYLWVLDEAQLLSPALLTELLTEGRKFGVGVVLATQFPERLVPELRAAVRASASGLLVFRSPPAAAGEVARWAGLPEAAAGRIAALADGEALRVGSGASPGRPVRVPEPAGVDPNAWSAVLQSTHGEFGEPLAPESSAPMEDPADREALLSVLAGQHHLSVRPVPADDRLAGLERRGWVERGAGGWQVTAAGERIVGLRAPTAATTESAEHRALLRRAFLLFARRGLWMEILRQDRFDTRLPDARVVQFPAELLRVEPEALAGELEQRRHGWAWGFFGGRHVHIEAEVSGARRPERIRHGIAKARAAGAFALFLVSDASRARRVRAVLGDMVPRRAQVWTLPGALGAERSNGSSAPAASGSGTGRCGPS